MRLPRATTAGNFSNWAKPFIARISGDFRVCSSRVKSRTSVTSPSSFVTAVPFPSEKLRNSQGPASASPSVLQHFPNDEGPPLFLINSQQIGGERTVGVCPEFEFDLDRPLGIAASNLRESTAAAEAHQCGVHIGSEGVFEELEHAEQGTLSGTVGPPR